MNKNLVTSLKLSRELKELGVKQESEFYWSKNVPQKIDNKYHLYFQSVPDGKSSCGQLSEKEVKETCYSAFLSDELGKMLPRFLLIKKVKYWLQFEIESSQGGWSCQYTSMTGITIKFFEEKTMVNAGGEMLAYLKENKLLNIWKRKKKK